jgi:hypothetical protein
VALLWSGRRRRWRSGEEVWPKHIDDLGTPPLPTPERGIEQVGDEELRSESRRACPEWAAVLNTTSINESMTIGMAAKIAGT